MQKALIVFPGLIALLQPLVRAQGNAAPVISGIVSAASYTSPLAPGSIISIFGSNLAVGVQSAGASTSSLPTTLNGTTVQINNASAALEYVSPTQINAQIPSSVPVNELFSFPVLSTVPVVVSTAAGSSAAAQATIFAVGPGLFTSDSSGCGPAAALNITPNGSVSVNSSLNSAAPGDYIALFGTGLGIPTNVPSDGEAASAADPLVAPGTVNIDFPPVATTPSYSGLAPAIVGADQVNFQIPPDTREGCAVPVSMNAGGLMLSPVISISINNNRGQCSDPPQQSYGDVWLEKTIASGTANDGETDQFNAVFPSGPALKMPSAPVKSAGTSNVNFFTPSGPATICPVAGYTRLSAGTISIQGPVSVSQATAAPQFRKTGAEYRQALPVGFVQPGEYSLSSQPNAQTAVAFQQTLSVGSPITIQTPLSPGTALDPYNDRVITWTGGDPSSLVRVTFIEDVTKIDSFQDVSYASASDGSAPLSYCFNNSVHNPPICTYFFLESSTNAKIIVDVLPAHEVAVTATNVSGISQQVRYSWAYHYAFGGLTIKN